MRIFAHRGASLRLPENTIEAFRRGLYDGADALELDVRVTKDGVVIVFHDDTGWRTARVNKSIAHTTWEQIKTWDLTKPFKLNVKFDAHFLSRKIRVPTLKEVFEAFPNTFINVDIKTYSAKSVQSIVTQIQESKATDRVRLTSYSFLVHHALNKIAYDGLTGLSRLEMFKVCLLPTALLNKEHYENRAIQIQKRWMGYPADTSFFVKKCKKLGLKIEYWTINKKVDAEKLSELGADGIITDNPAAVSLSIRIPSSG